MASVSELILAAQAAQDANRPFKGLLDIFNTYQDSYRTSRDYTLKNRALDDAHSLSGLEIEQKKMELEYMKAQAAKRAAAEAAAAAEAERKRKAEQEVADATEALNKKNFAGVEGKLAKPAVLPAQKLENEVNDLYEETTTTDYKGHETTVRKAKDRTPPKSYEEVLANLYNTGQISLDEFQKRKQAISASNESGQVIGLQDGQAVIFNPKSKSLETRALPGKGPLQNKTQTEGQANATIYGTRAEQAHAQIENLSGKTDLTGASAGIQGSLPNFAKSSEIQSYEQAKRNFLNAILRRESGAVISPTEFSEGNKQYFPQFGDRPEVLEQKRINRETAIAGLQNAAGGTFTQPSQATQPSHGWTPEKEARYQELLRKRGGR